MKVIVDGVNVTGCGYYSDIFGHCDLCGIGTDKSDTFCCYCKDNTNCYYKQLIRLKQQHNDDTEEIAKLGLDVVILEQENEKLKESIEKLLKVQYSLADNCKKYEQTLEDIKNEMSDKYQFGGLNGYEDFCKYYEREYTRIISKIDEVLK